LRYYSTKSAWPWVAGGVTANLLDAGVNSAIDTLISAGELKSGFTGYVGTGALSTIFVASTGLGDLHVCYMPSSKSFQLDPNTIYDSAGTTSITNCKSVVNSSTGNDCYYCIQ
jgi:hypothetical protein